MSYDPPFLAIEEEVISEVATFEGEGLLTLEEWEGEKEMSKICWSRQGIKPECPGWKERVPTGIKTLKLEQGDTNKVSCIMKYIISPILHYL